MPRSSKETTEPLSTILDETYERKETNVKWVPVEDKKETPEKPPRTKCFQVFVAGHKELPPDVIENCYDETEALAAYVKKYKLNSYAYQFRAVQVRRAA